MSTVVEELFARLGIETDSASWEAAQQFMGAARVGMMAVAAAAGAVGAAIGAAVVKTAEYADKTANAAERSGVAVEAFQALQYAAERADVSTGALEGALRFAAKRGVKDLEGELRHAADQFERMPDGAAKSALAMKLFGKNGTALIPMLNKGSAGLDAMMAKARDMGFVLSAETQAQAVALKTTLDDLKGYVRGFAYVIAGPFLKPIREALERVLKWIRDHRPQIQRAVEAIGAAVGNAFKYAVQLIEPVVDLLGRFIGWVLGSQVARAVGVLAMLGAALSAPWAIPLVAVLLLLGALEELWGWVTGERKTLLGDWLGEFDTFMKADPSDSAFHRGLRTVITTVEFLVATLEKGVKLADRLFGGMVEGGQQHAKYLGLSGVQKDAIWDQVQREADSNPKVNISNRADFVKSRVNELTASMYAPTAPSAPSMAVSHGGTTVNVGAIQVTAVDGTDAGRQIVDKLQGMIRSHSDAEYSGALPAAAR